MTFRTGRLQNGTKKMKIAFTWDDGAPQDIRLFELHRKYHIPGMFFIPTRNAEGRAVLTENQIRTNADELISFGGHTQNHVYLTEISRKNIEREITENKKYLENILQKEIEHFCFPGGKYTEEIEQTVFRYFRTVRTADTMNFKKPKNNKIKPSIHFYPRGIKSLIGNGIRQCSFGEALCTFRNRRLNYFDIVKRIIARGMKEKGYLVIWGHSWEIELMCLWKELESLFCFLNNGYRECIIDYEKLFD